MRIDPDGGLFPLPHVSSALPQHSGPYTVSMHSSSPGSNGSIFYIMFAHSPTLDEKYAEFGYVCEGHEVVDAIELVLKTGALLEKVRSSDTH